MAEDFDIFETSELVVGYNEESDELAMERGELAVWNDEKKVVSRDVARINNLRETPRLKRDRIFVTIYLFILFLSICPWTTTNTKLIVLLSPEEK